MDLFLPKLNVKSKLFTDNSRSPIYNQHRLSSNSLLLGKQILSHQESVIRQGQTLTAIESSLNKNSTIWMNPSKITQAAKGRESCNLRLILKEILPIDCQGRSQVRRSACVSEQIPRVKATLPKICNKSWPRYPPSNNCLERKSKKLDLTWMTKQMRRKRWKVVEVHYFLESRKACVSSFHRTRRRM